MEEQQSTNIAFKSKVDLEAEDYREYPAINYSTLSSLSKSPRSVNKKFKETDAMTLGSIVDNLLTLGSYGDEYLVSTETRPTGQMGDFCDYVLEENIKGNQNAILSAYERVGFKRDKVETVVKRLNSEHIKYYRFLEKSVGKKVVDMEVISKATRIVNGLKNNPDTKFLFSASTSSEIEILYQVPLVFDLPEGKGKGKCLIDIVVINHADKTITLYDLKTTGFLASSFKTEFIKWKYYLQASFYYYGFSSLSSYGVTGFNFVVASTIDPENPLIWSTSQKDLHVGRFGIKKPNSEDTIKGWEQLSKELIWHIQSAEWNHPYEFYNRNINLLDAFSRWE